MPLDSSDLRVYIAHARDAGDKALRWGTAQLNWLKEQRINGLHAVLAVSTAFLLALLIGTHAGSGSVSFSRGRGGLQPAALCDDVRHPVLGSLRKILPNCTNRYRSSPWEQGWVNDIAALESDTPEWEDGCAKLRGESESVKTMIAELGIVGHSYCTAIGVNTKLPLELFSTFEVVERCEVPGGTASMRHNHTIEPLVSFLRDPRAVCSLQGGKDPEFDRLAQDTVFSREFLLLSSPPCEGVARNGRRILFAVGSRPEVPEMAHAGGGIKWLAEEYAKKGIPLDALYVWEPKDVGAVEFFQGIPEHLRPLTHFFNVPLETDPQAALNPLRVILAVAHPEDFVVIKIDTDEPDTERRLVEMILETPELVDIIDEIFWEHMTTGSPMQFHGWGDAAGRTGSTLSDTYRLLLRLRQLGIRAHSWA